MPVQVRLALPEIRAYGGHPLYPPLLRVLRKTFRQILLKFGTEARVFYRKRLVSNIDKVTVRRTGRLRKVRVRKRSRSSYVHLIEDFPETSFPGGQYAYVVNARRKFISNARGATNAEQDKFLARAVAKVQILNPNP